MKPLIKTVLMIAVVLVLTLPEHVKAQVIKGDTMFVYTNKGYSILNSVIKGDTLSSGARKDSNRVYVLFGSMSPDSVYYWDNGFSIYHNISIIGKPDPATGMLPVISPVYNPDGSLPTYFFRTYGAKSTVVLKNLFFECTSPNDVNGVQQIAWGSGQEERLIIDHCVFSDMLGSNMNAIGIGGVNMKIYVTNNVFRNIQATQIWGASVCWTGQAQEDTILFRNNTAFCVERALDGSPGGPHNAHIIDHNTIYFAGDAPIDNPQATNSTITNNIFYSTFAAGVDDYYRNTGFYNAPGRIPGIILIDSLRGVAQPPKNFLEVNRAVKVSNNVYSWHPALPVLWKAITDTTHDPGLVTKPVWMDDYTKAFFNDKVHWPNMSMAKNDSIDPGFNAAMVSATMDSLKKWIVLFWGTKTTGSTLWWQNKLNPVTMFTKLSGWNKSKQVYPVPENLRYSNAALYSAGTDGKALGDLNWFPEQLATDVENFEGTLPTEYSLSNNYPNPFNPSTQIEYTVPYSGFVTLKVYNLLGQDVATLFAGMQLPGRYMTTFDGSKFPSGVYFYRLEAQNVLITKKLVLIK